jgi:FlaA1/EpsC-like NDP-sugar epimerase
MQSRVGRKASDLARYAVRLPRATKRIVMVAADMAAVPLVLLAAICLRIGGWPEPQFDVAYALAASIVVAVPIFAQLGLYRAVVRFLGPRAATVILGSVTAAVAVLLAFRLLGSFPDVPVTSFLIFWSLLLLYVGGSRMTAQWLLRRGGADRARVVVYGAGEAGAWLAAALSNSRQHVTVAFVDDNPGAQGTLINGVEVFPPDRLPELLVETRANRVLLAMPSLSRRRRREILDALQPLGVHVQTVPGMTDIVTGVARVDDIRDVEVADLLGRDAVPPNQVLLGGCIRGKTVLVTGAGGSIGSELCRQILRLQPSRLLLLEMSELALYTIERELRLIALREGLNVELVALLGNAHHKYRVREILQTFAVQTIYHAAAYKHVPIVEHNIIEGLHNNVFSTWYTAEAALECKVETFVLISTDKAVNPTNVMGATKRFAEIVLQGLQQRSLGTRFCMVRFGNVLESSGSVVPLFREQIRHGGPVTVTHPDVIRYFMTIPEAAQLVLQAGSMAQGGDVFVLDMGKPVRIADLARRMVQLSGLTVRDDDNPDGDVEIRYVGLRPAEKLYEELLIGKNVTGTEHSMIMRAVEHALSWDEVQSLLEELGMVMRRFDCRAARDVLTRAVREYRPGGDLQDLVWARRVPPAANESKVTDLQSRRSRQLPAPRDL